MLMTMEPEIQQNLEPLHAHEMLKELKTLFARQAEQELLQTTRDFHSCRQEEGQSDSICHECGEIGHRKRNCPQYLAELMKKKKNTASKAGGSVWVYEALVKRDTLTKPDKLEPRAIKCIFVGYPKKTMGYSFYYPSENKVLVARNAEFIKNSLIDQEASGSLEDFKIIQEEDTHPSLDTSLNHKEEDLEIDEPQ
nr:zinc finger, CCHC-type [Tanacetum cinerariifolium]